MTCGEFGLYADQRWTPNWPHELIDWRDFRVPERFEEAADQISGAFHRARKREHVEIGCAGGIGRTGTILACMAVLAGVPKAEAVGWVRKSYSPHAIETDEQERWVERFADYAQGGGLALP